MTALTPIPCPICQQLFVPKRHGAIVATCGDRSCVAKHGKRLVRPDVIRPAIEARIKARRERIDAAIRLVFGRVTDRERALFDRGERIGFRAGYHQGLRAQRRGRKAVA